MGIATLGVLVLTIRGEYEKLVKISRASTFLRTKKVTQTTMALYGVSLALNYRTIDANRR